MNDDHATLIAHSSASHAGLTARMPVGAWRSDAALDELGHDLSSAGGVQRRLLPPKQGRRGRFSYGRVTRPASWLSGDLALVIPVNDHQLFAAVGDVAGHGLAASVLSAAVTGFLTAAISTGRNLPEIVDDLNAYLVAASLPERFTTLWIGAFDAADGRLRYLDAGHGYAVRLACDGAMENLTEGGGPPLGIDRGSRYRTVTAELDPGDQVVVFSDGVVDGHAGSAATLPHRFRIHPALASVAHHPATSLPKALRDALARQSAAPARDDFTILAVEYQPQAAARATAASPPVSAVA